MADEKYDQDFFLALAAKGKDAWNEWRRDPAHKDVRVTFAGIDFSEPPRDKIDFSGFEFGNDGDFSQCKWRGGWGWAGDILQMGNRFSSGQAFFKGAAFGRAASFVGATFGSDANFTGTAFGDSAIFTYALFGPGAKFDDAVFGDETIFDRVSFATARFVGAVLGDKARFLGAIFGGLANFEDVVFGDDANFKGAAFAATVNFEGAAFGWETSFEEASFRGDIEFKGKTEDQSSKDLEVRVRNAKEQDRAPLRKRHEDSWTGSGSAPDRFLTISFANVRFDNEAVFSVRSFEADANFTNARFYYPPDFDAVRNASRIDFTGAIISFVHPRKRLHLTTNGRIPVRLRAFRKIAEETKNHDLERDLYIEERKAERGVFLHQRWDDLKKAPWIERPFIAWRLLVHVLWIIVMFFYWALSDYGRNIVLPAAWLIASVLFFDWRYTKVLGPLMAKAPDVEKYKQALGILALGNAVPFVGPLTIDTKIKEFLFCAGEVADKCTPIPPDGFQFWVVFQNVVSIILVFFIGLALRNYFRIK